MNRSACAVLALLVAGTASAVAEDWTRFRGPQGGARASVGGLPITWSDNENIAWKLELPGEGASTPITLGDRIYLTAYSGYGTGGEESGSRDDLTLHLICVDGTSGKIVWDKTSPAAPNEKYEQFTNRHGFSSGSAVTDGEAVYAFFGVSGVLAYDLEGNELWRVGVGDKTHSFGTGASPILFDDLLIVNASVESGQLVALDKKTGRQVWAAPDIKRSWSTPIIVEVGGQQELVLSTDGAILGFDPRTGERLWSSTGIDDYICPSVIAHEDVVYAIGGRKATAIAVRAGGRGDVADTHVLWSMTVGSNVPSPVYHEGHLYWVSDKGIAHCVNAETGETVYQQRLENPGIVYASVTLVDDVLYAVSRENGTFVIKAQPEFELLAHNKLESDTSVFNASPVPHNGRLLLRSDKALYAIGKQ